MCHIMHDTEGLVTEIEEVLDFDDKLPKVDGRLMTVNISEEAYKILKDEWGEHEVLKTTGAYALVAVDLVNKLSDIRDLQEKVDPHSKCAMNDCPNGENCPLAKLALAREDVEKMTSDIVTELRDYKAWAQKASFGNNWTFMLDSPVGGWGIF